MSKECDTQLTDSTQKGVIKSDVKLVKFMIYTDFVACVTLSQVRERALEMIIVEFEQKDI